MTSASPPHILIKFNELVTPYHSHMSIYMDDAKEVDKSGTVIGITSLTISSRLPDVVSVFTSEIIAFLKSQYSFKPLDHQMYFTFNFDSLITMKTLCLSILNSIY